MKRIIPFIKNKYYITLALFLTWMIFLDRNDFIAQYQHITKLNTLRSDKAYYQKEIVKAQSDLQNLSTDQDHLETFAREKYLMKKDNEDVFIIVKQKEQK